MTVAYVAKGSTSGYQFQLVVGNGDTGKEKTLLTSSSATGKVTWKAQHYEELGSVEEFGEKEDYYFEVHILEKGQVVGPTVRDSFILHSPIRPVKIDLTSTVEVSSGKAKIAKSGKSLAVSENETNLSLFLSPGSEMNHVDDFYLVVECSEGVSISRGLGRISGEVCGEELYEHFEGVVNATKVPFLIESAFVINKGDRKGTITLTARYLSDEGILLGTDKNQITIGPKIFTPYLEITTPKSHGNYMVSTQLYGGEKQRIFQLYLLDAAKSSEDITVSDFSLPLVVTKGASRRMITGCYLRNAETAAPLNTGKNLVNPSNYSHPFNFDRPLTIKKEQKVLLQLVCEVDPGAKGAFAWGLSNSPRVYGVESKRSAKIIFQKSDGLLLEVVSSLILDSIPGASGAARYETVDKTEISLGDFVLRAKGDGFELERLLFLVLFGGQPVSEISVWDGAKNVGYANVRYYDGWDGKFFIQTDPVVIPKGGSKTLTVKAKISPTAREGQSFAVRVLGGLGASAKGLESKAFTQIQGEVRLPYTFFKAAPKSTQPKQ